MNSEQFKRLCKDVASSKGALVTVGTDDLRALIAAYQEVRELLTIVYNNPHKCAFRNAQIKEFLTREGGN